MRCLLLIMLGLPGCGYSLVRADRHPIRIGLIGDASAEAQLGRQARRALIARAGEAPEDAPAISGLIRVLPDVPIAIDAAAAQYQVAIELDAGLDGAGGWRYRAIGEASFLRGPSVAETLAARRLALRRAVDRGVERWWARWIERSAR